MRKKTRKFCAITLAAVMATTYMPYFPQGVVDLSYTVKAAQVTSGDFKYETNGASSISITGYTGTEGVVTIPNEIDGYKVTQIAKEAFKENKIITSVTIPDSVTIINDSAFYSCTMLESVTMGNGIRELGSYVFAYCTQLSSVKLSSALTTVNSAAFKDCTALENISIPASLNTYKHDYDGMFDGCTHLYTVVFEEGTKVIPAYILRDCGVENITIPNTVTKIESNAFSGCSNLKSIVMPDNVKELGSYAFAYCTQLSGVKLSSSLTTVYSAAFKDCTVLENISIPASLNTYKHDYDGMFDGCTHLYTVIFEEGTKVIPAYILRDCGAENVYIPSSATAINSYAFLDCSNLENVYFYGNAPTFGDNVFQGTSYVNGNYLKSNTTWSSVVNNAIYSNITWVALDAMPEVPTIEEPVVPTVTVAPVVTNVPTPVDTSKPGNNNTPGPISTTPVKPTETSEPTHQSKMVKVEEVAATCTKSGCKAHWECAICGAMFSDEAGTKEVTRQDLMIPAIGHHVVTDAAVAATTTSTGLTEGTHCAICQRVLKVQSVIPKLPEVQSGFRYKEDTWKFTNPTSYIKPKIYEMFFDKERARELQEAHNGTGGHCAGMAITVMASYCGFPAVASYGPSFTCLDDLSKTDKSNETNCSALDYVDYGYAYQCTPSFYIAKSKTQNDYEGLYSAIYDFQHNNGSPVYVSIGKESQGHALVGLAISEDTDTYTKILVYDCNYSNEQRYLTLTKSNGKYTGWSYNLTSRLNWNSTNKNARINYVKLGTDFINAFDPNKAKASDGFVLLSISRLGTGILSYGGENINLSSVMMTKNEKVIPITPDIEENTNSKNLLWLDGDSNISVSNLSAASEISLTDDKASISAQSSSVSDMTIDMDKQSVEISDAGASTVTVNYEKSEDYTKSNVTSITGTSNGTVKMKQAANSDDIVVTGMKECAITLFDETISETANTSETVLETKVTNMNANNSYKISTTETATQTTVTVSADTNSDGTYDKVVATETKTVATTASPAPGTENKDKENATETKTETATPSPAPGTENKNNTVTAENKTENTVTTQEVQTIKVTTSKTFKVSKLKKKALTFKIAGKASSGNKIAYKLVKANKNIKFDAKTGIVTIKKGTKKGTYKIKVKMTVKGNSKYKAYSTTKTITIKVKK